ncbi:transposase [Streptomyces nigrescens]
MGRGDLTDEEWERLRPFLPVSNRRCGRWWDHRQVIDGILHRVRTGVQWRDLARVAMSHSRTRAVVGQSGERFPVRREGHGLVRVGAPLDPVARRTVPCPPSRRSHRARLCRPIPPRRPSL